VTGVEATGEDRFFVTGRLERNLAGGTADLRWRGDHNDEPVGVQQLLVDFEQQRVEAANQSRARGSARIARRVPAT
jgi:hypothetical protein